MSRPDRSPVPEDPVLALAADWLAREGAGLTPAEAVQLDRWLAADPRHAAAFKHVKTTHNLLLRLPQSRAGQHMLAEVEALTTRRRRTRVLRFPAIGALAAAACLAVAVWFARSDAPAAPARYVTQSGERQSVQLADGSTLMLLDNSEVEVAFASAERRVELRRGESHFAVAKDPARPFIVAAGTVTVRAVGTAFNVRHAADAVEVVVTEGKVQVSRHGTDSAATPQSSVFLVGGDRLVIDMLASGLPPLAAATTPRAASSAAPSVVPRLFFSDTPLSEVVARFNEYNQLQIELAEPELGTRAVGGNFDANNAESFIALLSTSGDVRVERIAPDRVRLHKAR